MMEPRIQYAKTSDGVSIAYSTLGEGLPLVLAPTPEISHIQAEWQLPGASSYYERLAEERMVVRYDGRGTGLSDRDVTDFTLDTFVLDLEAVVTRLGLKRFDLLGSLGGGPVAIAYAASHPERVSHLLLWCSYPQSPASPRLRPGADAIRALMNQDWVIYTETVTRMYLGWSAGEEAHRGAAYFRESVTQETLRAIIDVFWELDVTTLLPQVRAPTLVLCRREGFFGVEPSRGLASGLQDARLVVVEGQSLLVYTGDVEPVLQGINEFLGGGEEAKPREAPATQEATTVHTIIFTDMESSTALRRKLGDAKVQELVRTHNQIVRTALGEHAGNEIKHTGDGIMASFSTATSALQCAIAIQQGVASHIEKQPDMPLGVHIGLNAGEPIAEEEDLFGTSVDLARRICDHAQPGQILASNVVRELSEGKGFLFGDIGDVVPKGFEDPVRLYEVRWREDGDDKAGGRIGS